MKFIIIFLLLLGCVPAQSPNIPAEYSDGKQVNILVGTVCSITDGDTFTVKDAQGEEHRVRMGEIDAPEKSQEFGKESKDILSSLILEKEVTVYWHKKDRFDWKTSDHKTKKGRIIGGVFMENQSVNRKLVEMGAAWHYTEFSKDETIKKAQDYAKENEYGLWGSKNPIPPWKWRKK